MTSLGGRRGLLLAMGSVPLLFGGVTEQEAAAQAEPARLQATDLPKFLEALGYDTTPLSNGIIRITADRAKFTFRINTSISGNTKKVWLSTFLIVIPEERKTPDFLGKLLAANADVGPAHFYLTTIEGKTWLKMGYALDNRDVTPKYFREEFDWFCERISDKSDLWAPAA